MKLFCLGLMLIVFPLDLSARPLTRSNREARRVARMGLQLPIIRQAKRYSCGAACLMSVLQYYKGFNNREEQLYRSLRLDSNGVRPQRIVLTAQQHGLNATFKEELTLKDLRLFVDKGQAAILDIQAWRPLIRQHLGWENNWEDGHYVVLKAVGQKYIYLMDPAAGPNYTRIPLNEFLTRWHDYGQTKNGERRNYLRSGIVIDANGIRPSELPGLIDADVQ